MIYTNNQMILRDYIKNESKKSSMIHSEAEYFEYFSAQQILKNYDLDDEEIESGLIGGALDGGCDGLYIFLNQELVNILGTDIKYNTKEIFLEFIIIQSKNTFSFKEDALMKWKTLVENLLCLSNNLEDFKTRYNEKVLELFSLFQKIYLKTAMKKVKMQFNFYYVTLATEVHPNVNEQAKELEKKVKEYYPIANVNVNFEGADKLFKRYNTACENMVNLKLEEIPIAPNNKPNYLTLVSLKNYYYFIVNKNDEMKKTMLEANVRDYQGKNTVNKSIYKTLENQTEEDFWWLNNGITILASDVALINNKELQLTNPKIVNGLQTSTEIYKYYVNHKDKLNIDNRCILVRIIVPENEKSRDSIIFATNNQTSISKTSLRATDEIHLQIEMYLKNKGLFYDRRKNYYKNQGKDREKIISISFLGQCLITLFLKKPDFARARPSTILMDDNTYKKIYNFKRDLEVFYKVALIGRKIEKFIKKSTKYERTERQDILFYVLYATVISILNKNNINDNDIKNLNLDLITNELLIDIREKIYDKYKSLGGNSTVAKNKDFVNEIDKIILT